MSSAHADDVVLKVLSVASEMYPLIKTGGLADVVGALPAALSSSNVAMRTLLPGYPAVIDSLQSVREVLRWPVWFGGPARLLSARHDTAELLVLDAPHLYARSGNPYLDADGRDWSDNAERFAALSFAAARIGWGELGGFVPDVIHVHDWQAALVPVYVHFMSEGKRRPATVLTLHNLAFQGQFRSDVFARLGMPDEARATHGLEYYGDINYLKAGILFADAITTVSPTYAREILTREGGMGMDAMLRWRGAEADGIVSGIVNGIDTDVWNPATDAQLLRNYEVSTLDARKANKPAVEQRFGLGASDTPLICMITRLTEQKGIDLVVDALEAIAESGARLVVLGSGDTRFETALSEAASRWPDRIAVRIGYDEGLSHLMQAGCDAILIPSRFEPCGLTQLCGLRYGCVPVVSRVGGLADTVVDASDANLQASVATGIQFTDISVEGVVEAVRRTVDLRRDDDVWKRVQVTGMRSDVSWDRSAAAFAALYHAVVDER